MRKGSGLDARRAARLAATDSGSSTSSKAAALTPGMHDVMKGGEHNGSEDYSAVDAANGL